MKKIIIILFSNIFARGQEIENWSRAIADTYQIVNSKSYYPPAFDTAVVKALDAFVGTDENSRFLSPKDYSELIKITNGEFFGLGVILAPKKSTEEFLLILDTLPCSPAQKKGLKRFDKILAIDGTLVSSLSIDDAINRLKGSTRHSKVTLDIVRENELIAISFERDLIKDEPISCYYLKSKNIVYCAITLFTHKVAQRLKNSLEKAILKNPRGLIIDLRDNAGGILQSAVECASLFLPPHSFVVCTKDREKKTVEKYNTQENPIITSSIPIFILVNNYTASAAEILADALRYYAVKHESVTPYVYLIGTKTYGKGSVQEVIPMQNNCALKLTTCLYVLPNGKCIQNNGLNPDFKIEQKINPEKILQDSNVCDWKSKKINSLKNDYQLQTAIQLTLLLNLGLKTKRISNWTQGYKWLNANFYTPEIVKFEEL